MPRRKAPKPIKRIVIRPKIKKCPACQTTLIKRRHKDRIVWTFEGPIQERTIFLRCPNPYCEMHNVEIRPAETLAPPRLVYDKKVIAEIVILREYDKKSFREIARELAKRGIEISHETVRKIYEQYLILAADKIEEDTLKKIRELGCAIIAIDGVQPEKGKASLWIVTELQVERPIHAQILENQTIDAIADMLREVKKKLGVPIIAVVSDGQQSIVKAVKKALPEAKHQFCHFHYIRNISRKACDADRNLAKKIRARIRSMYHYRKSRNMRLKPSKLLVRVGRLIHAILATRARYPLRFAGIEIYERLRHLVDCLRNIKDSDVQKLVVRIANVLSELKRQYDAVSESVQIIRTICEILDNPEGLRGRDVRRRLLDHIKSVRPKTSLARKVLKDVNMYTKRWIGNLFYTYDDPRIPRTNNAMESLIGRFKRHIRRVTGWRHSNDFCVRWGKFLVFVMYVRPEAILGLLERLAWDSVSGRYRRFCAYLGSIGLSAYSRASLRNCDYSQYLKTDM